METVENQTYSYYFARKELPEFVILSVWVIVVSTILGILSVCSSFYGCLDWFTDLVRNPTIEFAFGAMLKRDDDEFTVFDKDISSSYAHVLYVMVLNLIGVALVQFWDDFLIEESRGCNTDAQLACFPLFPDMDTPRLNCSDTSYLVNNNITSVVCYRLVYKIGTATASALGVVTITGLTIYIFNLIFVKLSKIKLKWKRHLAVLIVHIILTVVVIAVTVVICYFQFGSSPTRADQAADILKNLYVCFALMISIAYNPWTDITIKERKSYIV